MMKYVLLVVVAVVAMQQAQAFKLVKLYRVDRPAPDSGSAVDFGFLRQSPQIVFADKLTKFKLFAGALFQKGKDIKQNALNSIFPFIIRKDIYMGHLPKQAPGVSDCNPTIDDAVGYE